ncbi:MAG: hypothetical protein V1842_01475 [Candidatus Omnitrophota bacterium]|nr:hypothetical protein [Candidatus Omnitrophota bacterium]MBU1928574.1 hypothetical protein [Candidatus Omnitrophota bacterium]MBU2034587.1 hypothetical protein [Candidatus Omnitrophota bacterium]MBU2221541.1 hypothetical protein [Candidatus Omnitrophota bacterium]MBU2257742.1 hypothetical protein [Candidatus Omnitrophota bacterium]
MEESEKANLAGIVDGEGTVTLMKHHKNETPIPYVSIANNNLKLLQWIKYRCGGLVCSKKKYKPQHNDSFAWSVRQDRALCFLGEIVKYLIVKKPQATLILEKYKSVTHRAGKYTPKMLSDKMKLVAKIRELNQR